jgi:ABC-2 type transport system permease protein
MRDIALILRQVTFENRNFWRNPAAAFFTFVFPLIFLVIFNVIFGNDTIQIPGGETNEATFYVPAIAALSVITACYTNIAMTICINRDEGVLKRIHGSPLPVWAFVIGRVLHSTLIAMLLVLIVTAFGAVFYDVEPPTNTFPAFVVTVILGAAAFSMLGIALAAFIPNADSAPAIVNATILPLFFISDVFIRLDDPPGWLDTVSNIFPVRHFSEALQTVFNPYTEGPGFEWEHLAVIAVWGIAGFIVAVTRFSWEPRV